MRWRCPHCRVALEASDDQISSNWLFSLCPQCSRFGLVRGNAQSAVKVDRAPQGEKFIRAAVCEEVTAPVIRPAQLRSKQEPEKTQVVAAPQPVAQPVAPAAAAPQPKPQLLSPIKLPEPLPEIPENRRAILPKLVLFGCLGILVWNGYRYLTIGDDRPIGPATMLSDQVVSKAMAPIHIDVGNVVQARSERMQIRNGPGFQFPVIGELKAAQQYQVLSVEDPWFQLQAGTRAPAWVMSDEITLAN